MSEVGRLLSVVGLLRQSKCGRTTERTVVRKGLYLRSEILEFTKRGECRG